MTRECRILAAAACALIPLVVTGRAAGAVAAGQQGGPPPQSVEWLDVSIGEVARTREYTSMVVLPNGKRMVLTAEPGREFIQVTVTFRARAGVPKAGPVKLAQARLTDVNGHTHPCMTKDMTYYPAITEERETLTFDAPQGIALKSITIGPLTFDLAAPPRPAKALPAR